MKTNLSSLFNLSIMTSPKVLTLFIMLTPVCPLAIYVLYVCRWETLDTFMQHDVQELCRVVSNVIIQLSKTIFSYSIYMYIQADECVFKLFLTSSHEIDIGLII